MAAITITPGVNFDEDDFWVASGGVSTNERFAGRTSFEDDRLLGLGTTTQTFSELQFEAGGLTYRYIGNWTLTTNGALLSSTVGAFGSYSEVVVEQNGSLLARLVTDGPLSVDFGDASGLAVAGLISLQPLLDLVFAADTDQSFANLHLNVTPNLPDLAGIEDGDIIPGPGSDMVGTVGNDVINGTAGNDTISALEGDDTINGDAGDDVLYGNQGNDTIDGGPGNNSVYGGQNDDRLIGGDGNDYMVGGLGVDHIFGSAGDDVIFGGNETIAPEDGADTIYGGQGNDLIYGNGGDDLIFGGDGPGDQTDGGDTLFGGHGDDTIYGNTGDDVIYGQRDSDILFGNEGNDFLHGGQENDTVHGGAGNDTILGGLGDDLLTGGAGSDLFVFGPAHGNDVVTDFSFGEGDGLDLQGQGYGLGQNNEGQAAIFLEDGGTIVLLGLTPDEFQAGFVA